MLKVVINDLTSVPWHRCEAYKLSQKDLDQLNGLKNILNVSLWWILLMQRANDYPQLFDALVKKFSETTTFQVVDVYGAFEALEVSLDKARNDVSLDKVVRTGANRALFILGKYYSKLDD